MHRGGRHQELHREDHGTAAFFPSFSSPREPFGVASFSLGIDGAERGEDFEIKYWEFCEKDQRAETNLVTGKRLG